jgi:hypothetical protein
VILGLSDAGLFMDVDSRDLSEPLQLRQFENENGELSLSLNPDIQEEDAVGTEVCSGGNWTRIVRMV